MARRATLQDYQAFGLEPGASEHDIKRAYRYLVRRVHPDTGTTQDSTSLNFTALQEQYHALLENPLAPITPAERIAFRTHGPSTHGTSATAYTRIATIPHGNTAWCPKEALAIDADTFVHINTSSPVAQHMGPDTPVLVYHGSSGYAVSLVLANVYGVTWSITTIPRGSIVDAVFDHKEYISNVPLAIQALQEYDRLRRPASKVMPKGYLSSTLQHLVSGSNGWCSMKALIVDKKGQLWIDPEAVYADHQSLLTPLRIGRDEQGYILLSHVDASTIAPTAPKDAHIPLRLPKTRYA